MNENSDSVPAPSDARVPDQQAEDHPPAPAPAPPLHDDRINILIVDDEPKNLTALETLLDNPDYRLVRAESADQALLALVEEEFALLILDIRMPGMTGFELAEMIKERKKTARVPIIFLTAYYGEDEHMLAAYDTGAVDFLHKPVNPTILRSKVGVFAELHRKNRESVLANRALLAEVAERRRAEEQLRELNETLEQRVRERTNALEKASAALKVSGERYRSLFDGSLDPIFSLGADGRFAAANPAALRLAGRTLEELTTVHFLDLCAPDQREAAESTFRAAFRRECLTMETTVITATGERRELFISGAPAIINGQVVGVSCIARDVTDRKRAEGKLREADRLKDEFLAMLGHELRNPLSAVANAIQVIHEADSEAGTTEWALDILDRQSRNLTRIVDDLLDVARITRGRIELRLQTVDVGQVIGRAVETVRPLIEKKNHQLKLALATGGHLVVEGDPARLEQCIVNLLVNAAKYTPEGGRIAITERLVDGEAVISVRDNGIGIASHLLAHIFELFTQAHHSLDRAEGGLGIGLNICRQLVELHGGAVTAHSDGLGLGAEFTIRIPALLEPMTGRAPVIPAPEPGAARSEASPRRVLVVDDNLDAAHTLSRLLTRRGHKVYIAYDGLEALKVAEDFQPDVFLLDLGLPGIDGYELARRLRAEGFAAALMIAISGYAQQSDVEKTRAAGFDNHFAKPVELNGILTAIRR